jgi:hypothetical protein
MYLLICPIKIKIYLKQNKDTGKYMQSKEKKTQMVWELRKMSGT